MSDLVKEINNSQARKILQNWLAVHQSASKEQLQDIASNLKNEIGQPVKYSALSPWFANNSKQAKLMPVNRAIELKACYPDFPLEEYLHAFIDFYEEYKPSDLKLHGFYGFIEAYGDLVGLGYSAQNYSEYFSIFEKIENTFSAHLPKTLFEEQKNVLEKALVDIMFLERDSDRAADVNSYLADMMSKAVAPNK
jgi:hypothetical protein